MKSTILYLAILSFLLSSCSLIPLKPKVTEHELSIPGWDKNYLQSWDVYFSQENLPGKWKTMEPPIYFFGKPEPALSGLDPIYPFAVTIASSWNPEKTIPAVYVKPCLTQDYIRYLFYIAGEYQLIESAESFTAFFAPIQSPEEALSLAIAVTGFHTLNDLEKDTKFKFINPPIDESFVQETEEGYIVHLFDTFMCGCGPHITPWVNILVKMDGSVSEIERSDAFLDPEIQDVCFD